MVVSFVQMHFIFSYNVQSFIQFLKHDLRFLRMDSLSLLLSLANVTSHSDLLVVDMIGGILTGAVAERLGGMVTFSYFPKENTQLSLFYLHIEIL